MEGAEPQDTPNEAEPLITVIVPVYNVEPYLKACVDSILAQTYQNLEIVLVDDGSPDACPEICDKYARKDERIKVIHRANGGLSAARNSGLAEANGDLIYFVDSDDMIHPECIERLAEIMGREDCDIVQCKILEFLDEDKIPYKLCEPELKRVGRHEMCRYLMFGGCESSPTIVWNKLYKRELFNEIRFPEGMVYEDTATTYQLFWKSEKIVLTNQVLTFYRQQQGSITYSTDKRYYEDFVYAQKMRCDFFKKVDEKELWEQGMYLLCSAYTKMRTIETESLNKKKIKAEHLELLNEVMRSGVSPVKKALAFIGGHSPGLWNVIWKTKRFFATVREWKGQSLRILRMRQRR